MRQTPRVLIVEDEPAVAEIIAVNLRHNGFEPIWSEDGESAQRELEVRVPHVIVLDWMLPGSCGIQLTRRWRSDSRTRTVPILMLSARHDEQDMIEGLEAGADDFIAKPFSTQELLARIRAVLRRQMPEQSPDTLTVGRLLLDTATYRVSVENRFVYVPPTEFKLLTYFMQHPERVHTRQQLLDRIWGNRAVIDERTIDVHVKRLRDALGDASKMVQTVRGAGYRLTGNYWRPHA